MRLVGEGSLLAKGPLEVMSEVRRLSEKSLWPGFDPARYPVAIYVDETTFLFGHPQPPSDFAESKEPTGFWTYSGRHPAMRSNSKARLGGISTATLLLTLEPARPVVEEAAILIHELFHIFQETHLPHWRPNEVYRFTYPVSSMENYVLSLLEDRALAHALESSEVTGAKGWAKKAMDIRSERTARLSREHQSFEQGLEMMEGTAFYVAHLALGEAESTSRLLQALPPNQFRWRPYATGGAIAALLDRFRPGWKFRCGSGPTETLEWLLRDSLSDVLAPPPTFGEEELGEVTDLARDSIEQVLQEIRQHQERFQNPAVWRVRIRASSGAALKIDKFDAVNIMSLGPGELLHGHQLTLKTGEGRVAMDNPRFVRRKFGGLNAMTRASSREGILGECKEVTFEGFDAQPEVRIEDGQVEVTAPGLDAVFAGATLERVGRLVVIRLNP